MGEAVDRLAYGMGQRDSRHHHANRRRRTETPGGGGPPKSDEQEERVPLAGYEELYEISRSGRVRSKTRAVPMPAYHHSPFIRITVNGQVVTLPKAKAIAQSWAGR